MGLLEISSNVSEVSSQSVFWAFHVINENSDTLAINMLSFHSDVRWGGPIPTMVVVFLYVLPSYQYTLHSWKKFLELLHWWCLLCFLSSILWTIVMWILDPVSKFLFCALLLHTLSSFLPSFPLSFLHPCPSCILSLPVSLHSLESHSSLIFSMLWDRVGVASSEELRPRVPVLEWL